MNMDKFSDSKCKCDNCDNTASKVINMDLNRVWLCDECSETIIRLLSK